MSVQCYLKYTDSFLKKVFLSPFYEANILIQNLTKKCKNAHTQT